MSSDNCSYTELLPNVTLPQQPPQRNEYSDIYRLSYNLYPIIGFMLTAMTCIFASLATGGVRDMRQVDAKYINPLMAKIFKLEKTSRVQELHSTVVGTPDKIRTEKSKS